CMQHKELPLDSF
nr:immunoglobulin light chain junction region [Macaca mulatta]